MTVTERVRAQSEASIGVVCLGFAELLAQVDTGRVLSGKAEYASYRLIDLDYPAVEVGHDDPDTRVVEYGS
jgi:hypothetical protein